MTATSRRPRTAASESQRNVAEVASEALDAVEGDLDQLLRPYVDDVALAVRLQFEDRSVCQAMISSVMPLNVLPGDFSV